MVDVDSRQAVYTNKKMIPTMNPSCPLGNMNWASYNWLGAEKGKARNPFVKQGKPTTYGGIDVWCGDSPEEKYYGSPLYFDVKNGNADYFAPYEYGQGPYTKDYYNSSNSYHSQTIQIVNHNGANGVFPLPVIGFTCTLYNPGDTRDFSPDGRWNFVWGHFTSTTKRYTYFFPMDTEEYLMRNSWSKSNLWMDWQQSGDPLAMDPDSFLNIKMLVDWPDRYRIFTEDLVMTGITISTWMGRKSGSPRYTGHSMFNLMPVIHPDFWKQSMSIEGGGFGSGGLKPTGSTMIMPDLVPLESIARNQWWKYQNITKFAAGQTVDLTSEAKNQYNKHNWGMAKDYY